MIAALELGLCWSLACGGHLHDRQVGRFPLLQRELGQFWDGEGLQWLAWLECDVANLLPWLNLERNGGHRLRKKNCLRTTLRRFIKSDHRNFDFVRIDHIERLINSYGSIRIVLYPSPSPSNCIVISIMFNFACQSQIPHVSQWKITCLVIGFFNPVIPFLFLASHLTDILSIPNPEPQIRKIPDPEKPNGDPSINGLEDM